MKTDGQISTVFIDSLYDFMLDKTKTSETLYSLEINIKNGTRQQVRLVIVDNLPLNDNFGDLETISVTFKQASEDLIGGN